MNKELTIENFFVDESLRFDCPSCGKVRYYHKKSYTNWSKKRNIVCSKCSARLPQHKTCTHKGYKASLEIKEKLRISHIGKKQSQETIKKRIEKNIGKKRTHKTRIKMMNAQIGRKMTNEDKTKMRISKLKRFQKLGIPTCEDKGAKEYFQKLNEQGYNFKPKTFWKWGYRADGFDEEKLIWVEYDTEYHNRPKQKEKDLIRQNNIIEYFEKIGKPLTSFIRIKSDKDGNVLEEKCVYGKQIF